MTGAEKRPMLRRTDQKNNNDVNGAVNSYFEDPLGSVKDTVRPMSDNRAQTEELQPASNEWQPQDNIPCKAILDSVRHESLRN